MRTIKLIMLLLSFNFYAQSSWQPTLNILSNTNNQRFDDVFFLNDNLGWAANGYYAAVFKTTDGGTTWIEQVNEASIGGDYYFRNIEFLDENIGFLGTLNGSFFKTIDGGDNWTLVNNITPNPSAICGLDAVGTSTIYGCGAYFTPAHIIKSVDSGATWQYINMSDYANALVEIFFLTENIGFVSGRNDNGATVLKTTDGGSTWIEIFNSNIVGEYVWKLQVFESNTDVIFGSVETAAPNMGKLIKTTDGGNTWNSYDAPESSIQAVGFINENHGWMGGHSTGFHETTDGGVTWNNLNIGSNLNKIFIINSGLAYASGTTIYKYTLDTLGTEEVTNEKDNVLEITVLNNPVKTHLEFRINYKSTDNMLIELYDASGRFVKRLSRELISQSVKKNYKFSIEGLAPGIYYIDFHNNAGRTFKKIIKL